MKSKRSILLITVLFLGVIILLSFIIGNRQEKNIVHFSELTAQKRTGIVMPAGFPQAMPFINAHLLEFYQRDKRTNDITAVIHSKEPVKEIVDYYINYGKQNGWQIMEARQAKDDAPAKLLLQKNTFILSIAVEKNKSAGSTITVSSTSLSNTGVKKIDMKDLKL